MVNYEEYLTQRHPRYGTGNPERVDYPVWEDLIRGNLEPFKAFGHFSYEGQRMFLSRDYSSRYRASPEGPHWHWGRYGQTCTRLADGRTIYTGGTVEMAYDPDFCIYNDVVVTAPNGQAEIYLYPQSVFPPSDYHTATRVGSTIYLIGALGYVDLRRPGSTQVLSLDIETFRIEPLQPSGTGPGWIYQHSADYDPELGSIVLSGGHVIGPDGKTSEANPWTVELDLEAMRWC